MVNNGVSNQWCGGQGYDHRGHPQKPFEDIAADICALLKVEEVNFEAA